MKGRELLLAAAVLQRGGKLEVEDSVLTHLLAQRERLHLDVTHNEAKKTTVVTVRRGGARE